MPVALPESCSLFDVLVQNETHKGHIVTTVVLCDMHIRLTCRLLQATLIGERVDVSFPAVLLPVCLTLQALKFDSNICCYQMHTCSESSNFTFYTGKSRHQDCDSTQDRGGMETLVCDRHL